MLTNDGTLNLFNRDIFTDENPFKRGKLDNIFLSITDIYEQFLMNGVTAPISLTHRNIDSDVLNFISYVVEVFKGAYGGFDFEYLIDFKYQQILQETKKENLNSLLISKYLLQQLRNGNMDLFGKLVNRHCSTEVAEEINKKILRHDR